VQSSYTGFRSQAELFWRHLRAQDFYTGGEMFVKDVYQAGAASNLPQGTRNQLLAARKH
jgi:hypothetical protein